MATDVLYTTVDGGTLEGGGQILRNTVALSALLGKPVCINNVRKNRAQPGLKAQHAAGLKLVADICGATAEGIDKGSRSVQFNPGQIRAGDYTADPGTAGSTTLLLQVSLPVLLFSSPPAETPSDETAVRSASKLTLRGGTNASHAPPIDYTQHVFLPFLYRHFGFPKETLNIVIKKRGYFPRGGGELRVSIPALQKGQTIPPLNLINRGSLTRIHGYSYVSGALPPRLAAEMSDAAHDVLKHLIPPLANEEDERFINISNVNNSDRFGSPGSGIILWAETDSGCVFGASALGEKKLLAKDVGTRAAEELLRNLRHGGCVDEYLQDQIIIFLALANGKSSVVTGPLTLHTQTAIWVAEQMTSAKFETAPLDADTGLTLITCEGIGLEGRL